MMDWDSRRHKRNKMERKRRQRLMRKIQKADALVYVGQIYELSSWGKRFGRVAKLRATG